MLLRPLAVLIVATMLVAACTPVSKQEQQELAKPINCSTAEGDLRVLASEKNTAAERLAEGLTAIVPAGIVVGSLRGVEGEKLEVAVGEYNRMIDQKTAEIRRTCGAV